MTDHRIRYILSGIKEEIRREKDPVALRVLARMGLFWNRELLKEKKPSLSAEDKVCLGCRESLPIMCFEIVHVNYTRKDGITTEYEYFRSFCKLCVNKRGWMISKDKRKKKIFSSVRLEKRD